MAMAESTGLMVPMGRSIIQIERVTLIFKAALIGFFCAAATVASAQVSAEKPLPMGGTIADDGSSVSLNWFDAPRTRAGAVTVKRRILGETGAESWKTIGPNLGTVFSYEDTTTEPGQAYEYQVLRTGRTLIDVGYWATGVDLPALSQRGLVYLVIDETVVAPLAAHLDRFETDLIGDGWQVTRREIARGNDRDPLANLEAATRLRSWLRSRYDAAPEVEHVVILVGRVPVIMSGRANPDGHEPVPQPTDLYYGDLDGQWRITAAAALQENSVPSDHIEMQVGRIDFANLSDKNKDAEIQLLRAYFDKNHHWRMGLHGDLRQAYGESKFLAVEINGLRNVVGPESVTPGGHHDVGEERPWLWGLDFGDWNGRRYSTNYANKAVFALNFGSGKQHFGAPQNPMTALLAQPWYPLAVGWGARPAWWLHHMALGDTIGMVHKRTVNNGTADQPHLESMEYYPTGQYLWRNPVWVNLLGDPTVHAYVLAPPKGLTAQATASGTELRWGGSTDPDVLGYRIFRATKADGVFEPIDGGRIVEGLTFLDPDPLPDTRYMVRSFGKKVVVAGSFFTLSQGVFADADGAQSTAEVLELRTTTGQAVSLPLAFSAPVDGTIHAFVSGPEQGKLAMENGRWRYTPPADFTGQVTLRYTVSVGGQTADADLRIAVAD